MLIKKDKTVFIDLAKIIPNKILTKSGNKTYPLNVAFSKGDVLVSRRKKKHSNDYIEKWITVPNGHICVWYSWPSGRNQSSDENNGVRFKYFILPQFIPLDKITLVALGLLEAEMETSQERANMVSFTNSESFLVNYVIKFFERFGIKTSEWHWCLTFNFKLLSYESSEISKLREKLAEKHWTNNTPISPSMKNRKPFLYTGNKNYVNMRSDTIRWGSLRIAYFDTILRVVIITLLNQIKNLLLNNDDKNIIKYYMKGIFAGECSVKLTKSGSIDSVGVGCTDESNKSLYKKYIKRLGIRLSKDDPNSICIHNKKNFYKLYKLELISLHPIRYRKFLTGLLEFKKFNTSEANIKEKLMIIRNEIKNNIKEIRPFLEEREMIFGGLSGLHNMAGSTIISIFGWGERKTSNRDGCDKAADPWWICGEHCCIRTLYKNEQARRENKRTCTSVQGR